jgi:formate hydrogenlyase subunit 3/multisubunit Na+/H+ antiporter MnhD subunit
LLFALLGSVLYLVGTALLYGSYGILDIVLLSHKIQTEPATVVAAALMTHAGAPAAASAMLSGLVVKVGLLAKTASSLAAARILLHRRPALV